MSQIRVIAVGILLLFVSVLAGAQGSAQVPWHPLDQETQEIQGSYNRFGPVWWRPELRLQFGLDSDPLFRPGFASQQDTVASIGLTGRGAVFFGALAIVEGSVGIGYQHYFQNTELRDTPRNWTAGGWLRLGPSALHGQYGESRRRYVFTSELDIPIRQNTRSWFGEWILPIGSRIELTAGYDWSKENFDLPLDVPAIPSLDRQERIVRGIRLSLGLGRTGVTGVFFGYRHQQYDFINFDDFDAQSDEWTLTWRLAPGYRGRANFTVGYANYRFDNPELSDFSGFILGGRFDLRLLGRFSTVVGADRRPVWSLFGTTYYLQTNVTATFGFDLFHVWRLRGGGQWTWADYRSTVDVAVPIRDQHWNGYRVALDYRTMGGTVYTLTYSVWNRAERADAVGTPFLVRRRWTLMFGTLWD